MTARPGTPELIDRDAPIPQRHPAIAGIDVDGERVLLDERNGRCHVLNPSANLIWSCLGTVGTVADLIDDLAGACGAPVETVSADVRRALADFAENRLLDDGRTRPPRRPRSHGSDGPRYREEPPTACMQIVDELGWGGAVSIDLPTGLRLGIRSESSATEEAVRAIFAPVVVDDPDRFEPNLSVRLEAGSGSGVQQLHTVYNSCSLAVRTRHHGRALRSLALQAWSFVEAEDPEGPVLQTTALERDGQIVLAPRRARAEIAMLEPRLRRAGIAVVDAPMLRLEQTDGVRVVVPATPFAPDDDFDAVADLGVERPQPSPGRYEVIGRLLVATEHHSDRVALVAGGVADLANRHHLGSGRALEAASALAGVPTSFSPTWLPRVIVESALELFD